MRSRSSTARPSASCWPESADSRVAQGRPRLALLSGLLILALSRVASQLLRTLQYSVQRALFRYDFSSIDRCYSDFSNASFVTCREVINRFFYLSRVVL